MQYWITKESGSDRLIVISDTVIYNSSPSETKLKEYERELKTGQIPNALTGTPFNYIRSIEASNENDKLKIYYGKENNLELVVKNEKNRQEIIDYLKDDKMNHPVYQREQLTWFQAGKKPLLIFGIALALVLYLTDIAAGIEKGVEYEVHGGRGGIALLLLGLAEALGVKGVLGIGVIVLLIFLSALMKRVKNPPVIETLEYKRLK